MCYKAVSLLQFLTVSSSALLGEITWHEKQAWLPVAQVPMSDFRDKSLNSECVAFFPQVPAGSFTSSLWPLLILYFFGAFLEMFTKYLTSRLFAVKCVPHLGTKKALLLQMQSGGSWICSFIIKGCVLLALSKSVRK